MHQQSGYFSLILNMSDLLKNSYNNFKDPSYNASDIEVLEGLEPVRRRPGMYIGGTDESALHHLVNEVFDNAMDEAVAGFASKIELELKANNIVIIKDNGRGIPIDLHPKFPDKSALEVIMTTLHSGGKFNNKVYQTSGGLHGVGLSVVNALSNKLTVEVIKDKKLWRQSYSKGLAISKLEQISEVGNQKHGTSITFSPDMTIFEPEVNFKAQRLYQLAKSKAYLFKGVEVKWVCDEQLITQDIPSKEIIKFPAGLKDYLNDLIKVQEAVLSDQFNGEIKLDKHTKVEWAIGWLNSTEGSIRSYCNTIPTIYGGSHENGFKNAILKGIRRYAEMIGNKKAIQINSEDIFINAQAILSIFIPDPHFQGQTKDKLVSSEATKIVENSIKDQIDLWLTNNKSNADLLLNFILEKTEERLSKKVLKETNRKSVTQRIRLPGKLADCTRSLSEGTELFLVEGDSAGGSAKQARNRETQAVLPLRGKILNVANSSLDKIKANQELADIELALGCGTNKNYQEKNLRYQKIVIMTDADVDGAHIASLLMTYFLKSMPQLIENGHLYLAMPPLYRIIQSNKTFYAQDEAEKNLLIKKLSKSRAAVEIGRFKGLGEMNAIQLKETTMSKTNRTLLRVTLSQGLTEAESKVDGLMGKKSEFRLKSIQEHVKKLAINYTN